MQQHGSKYFAHRPQPSKCQNSTFSEHGHVVACKSKANHLRSNMAANILPAAPYPPPPSPFPGGVVKSSKINFFRTWSGYISNSMESQMQTPKYQFDIYL